MRRSGAAIATATHDSAAARLARSSLTNRTERERKMTRVSAALTKPILSLIEQRRPFPINSHRQRPRAMPSLLQLSGMSG